MPCFQCKYLSSLFFFAVITSCSENVITPAPTVVPTAPSSEIADGAQDGHPRFYFLPPIGQESEFEGEVDATLRPEVTVCKLAVDKSRCNSAVALVADFKDVSLNGNHYQEEWRTAGAGLDTRPLYRVRVLVLGTELGHVDVRLVDNDHDSENEDKVIPLRVGRTLPIKFRIERGAVTVLDPSGGTVTSADGRVTLKVPPGALAGSTAITIVPASVPSDFLAGYDFQPEGLTFATPVTASIAVDPARIPAGTENIRISYVVNSGGTNWNMIRGSKYDPATHRVSAPIEHFSTHGIAIWGLTDLGCGRIVWRDGVYAAPLNCSQPNLGTQTTFRDTVFVSPGSTVRSVFLLEVNVIRSSYAILGVVPSCENPPVNAPDYCIGGATDASAHPNIASVDSGRVTGHLVGRTTLSGTYGMFTLATTLVIVDGPPVTDVRFGLGGVRAIVSGNINDITGARFRVKVVENQSPLKIIYGVNRLAAPGNVVSVPLEFNVYANRVTYADGACSTGPLLGTNIDAQASFRSALADYPLNFGQQSTITTGMLTRNSVEFPVQNYLVNNIATLPKSDAITQFNVTGLEAAVVIERAESITDVTPYVRCGRALPAGTYRKWRVSFDVPGHATLITEFVALEAYAKYITPNELFSFFSDFLNGNGLFTVQYWDFATRRESDAAWKPVTAFTTTDSYDGTGNDYGIHLVAVGGTTRIEFTNRAGGPFLGKNIAFALP